MFMKAISFYKNLCNYFDIIYEYKKRRKIPSKIIDKNKYYSSYENNIKSLQPYVIHTLYYKSCS